MRDGKGGLVSDLTADDFVVREDGRPQKVEVFAPAARPEEREELALNLGMLFDTSESMRKDLKLSQESAIRFLDAIPRARDLVLIFFDRDIRLSRYSSENQQGIFGRILEAEGQGFTALYDAITVYLSRVADTPGRKILVLFTDGDDTTSQVPPQEVQRLRSLERRDHLPRGVPGRVPAGQLGGPAGPLLPPLDRGAERRAGSSSRRRPASWPESTSRSWTSSACSTSSATSRTTPKRDGRFRRITVGLKRPALRVRHRPGYDAPKDAPPPKPKAPGKK